MITELLKVELTNLSFDLAVQKGLAKEQAYKDVQVLQGEQGPDTPNNKFDTAKTGENQASSKLPQKTQGSQGKDTKQPKPCYHCTGLHNSQKYPFIKEHCYHCGIIECTQWACRKKQDNQQVTEAGVKKLMS